MCDCELQVDEAQFLYHYLRTCQKCGKEWYSLHCPHDGVQNPCANCGFVHDPKEVTKDAK